jgi:hypothetical protein
MVKSTCLTMTPFSMVKIAMVVVYSKHGAMFSPNLGTATFTVRPRKRMMNFSLLQSSGDFFGKKHRALSVRNAATVTACLPSLNPTGAVRSRLADMGSDFG